MRLAILGIIIIIIGFILLFNYEQDHSSNIKDLDHLKEITPRVFPKSLDPALDGNLVYIQGIANTKEILSDELFGIQIKGISLRRKVEMYQIIEIKELKNGQVEHKTKYGLDSFSDEYTYKLMWSEASIDSNYFANKSFRNTPMPFHSETKKATNVRIGQYLIEESFVYKINNWEKVLLTQEYHKEIKPDLRRQFTIVENGEYFYKGGNPNSPTIGDIKVSFEAIRDAKVSLLGKQSNSKLIPFESKFGAIAVLRVGKFNVDALFQKVEEDFNEKPRRIHFLFRFIIAFGIYLFLTSLKFKNICGNLVFDIIIAVIGSLLDLIITVII